MCLSKFFGESGEVRAGLEIEVLVGEAVVYHSDGWRKVVVLKCGEGWSMRMRGIDTDVEVPA